MNDCTQEAMLRCIHVLSITGCSKKKKKVKKKKKKNTANWALLHLQFIHHNKGHRLIGTNCIYPKCEQTLRTRPEQNAE